MVHSITAPSKNAPQAILAQSQKASLKHGQWLPWVEENLPFDRRTATNYMAVFSKRETVSHLDNPTDAYRLLSAPAEPEAELPLIQEEVPPAVSSNAPESFIGARNSGPSNHTTHRAKAPLR